MNVGLSGSGTILAGGLEKNAWNKTQIAVGIFQFLTAAYLLGFFLSLYWAYLIVMTAIKSDDRAKKGLDTLNVIAANQDVINAAFGAQNRAF